MLKISIITATYNSGNIVRDTIESVLRQTYTNYEYIIKDGGPKDNTLDVVNEYAPQFGDKLKVISAPDQGIYDATYGDIHFVNDDDLSKCVRYYSSAVFRRSFMRFGLMPAHPSFYCKKAVYDKFGALAHPLPDFPVGPRL